MAGVLVTDYTSLKTELGNWLWNRSDVTSEIPTFIQLCEAQMNRRLQARLSHLRTTIAIAAETLAVPADFNGPVSLLLQSDPIRQLDFVTPDGLNTRQNGAGASQTGNPDSFTVEGGNFRFYPIPSASVNALLTYRQKIPSLSVAAPTNWVVTNHPDAYIYGSLTQSAPWLRDDNRLQMWAQMFSQVLDDIQMSSDQFESLGANLTPQSSYPVI